MSSEKTLLFLGFLAVVCMILSYLKSASPALAGAMIAGVSSVLAIYLLEQMNSMFSEIESYIANAANQGVKALIKSVYVSVASEWASSLCRDSGFSSLAFKAELAGKLAILALAMPLLAELFALLEKL